MSLGTITLTKGSGEPSQNTYLDSVSLPGESSYSAGGSAFDAAFKAKAGDGRQPKAVIAQGACGGYVPVYDAASGKLMVFYANADASDGPLIEVPDMTNLSSVTFKLLVISQ